MLNQTYKNLTTKELRVKISRRLHDERILSGFTLEKLANELYCSKPTVQSWERGWERGTGQNTIPCLDHLLALSLLYNCTPEYLLCEYDGKSKEDTDISKETGLTESNIEFLSSYFSHYKANPHCDACCSMYLAFINHFISHMDKFQSILFERRLLSIKQLKFQVDRYHDEIIEAHSVIRPYIDQIPKNHGMHGDSVIYKLVTDYYTAAGYENWDLDVRISAHVKYLDILLPDKIKRSDFEISDTFLDLTKDFFSDVFSSTDEYTAQLEKYVDPSLL